MGSADGIITAVLNMDKWPYSVYTKKGTGSGEVITVESNKGETRRVPGSHVG